MNIGKKTSGKACQNAISKTFPLEVFSKKYIGQLPFRTLLKNVVFQKKTGYSFFYTLFYKPMTITVKTMMIKYEEYIDLSEHE